MAQIEVQEVGQAYTSCKAGSESEQKPAMQQHAMQVLCVCVAYSHRLQLRLQLQLQMQLQPLQLQLLLRCLQAQAQEPYLTIIDT